MTGRRGNTLAGEPLELPSSLWAETAIAAPELKSLSGVEVADVVIIGAGFTGLSAAIRLAEHGQSCVVLEAAEPGWGASGRNNGQVIAGLKQDPDVIERLFPGDVGRKLVKFGDEAPSEVFSLISRYGIDCASRRRGWIQPAFGRKRMKTVEARCEAWRQRGVDAQLLEGKRLHRLLGTNLYDMAWLDPRGGSLQPLSYARGLARTALALGIRIFASSKVESLQRISGGWQAITAKGQVRSKRTIVATGAYAERLVPGLQISFVAVRTAQIATRPLPPEMKALILPEGQAASDTRQLLTSFRLSPDGRLVMGGSGATAGLDHSRIVPYLQKAGEELFGELGRLEWRYHWSGYFAVTTDHLPHVHEPARNLHIAVGCNGRGIAVSTALGKQLADRAVGLSAAELAVPVSSITPVPFHDFRRLGVSAATLYKRFQDCLD